MDLPASIRIARPRRLFVLASALLVAACGDSTPSQDTRDTGGDEDVDTRTGPDSDSGGDEDVDILIGTGNDSDIGGDEDIDATFIDPETDTSTPTDSTPDTTEVDPDTDTPTDTEPDTSGEVIVTPECDDASDCSATVCHRAACDAGHCIVVVDDLAGCDDGDPCTDDEACLAGTCVATDTACDDHNACTDDTCGDSGCSHAAIACDDHDACTDDACDIVLGCVMSPRDCSDGDACTTDSCDAASGCAHASIEVATACDDHQDCSIDACDPMLGCTHANPSCDDGDACTMNSCDASGCVFSAIDCDDQNACTVDACDSVTGCTHTARACNDGDACTTDGCNPASGCTHVDLTCDDSDACTADSCDAAHGCMHTGACIDPLAALSDDFEDAGTMADWQLRAQVEGEPPHHNLLDIDTTIPGALVLDANNYIAPNLPGGPTGAGWFEDNKGPLLFKSVTGDFLVVAYVQLGTTANIAALPSGSYNSGGLLARDPASAQAPLGDERWLMYNIGYQSSFFGSETKTTMPAAPSGTYSRSALFLTPTPGNIGRLAMCRIGTHFYFFRNMDSAPGWVQEVHTPSNVVVNNLALPGSDLESGFERPDLPATLQVGIMANRWTEGPVPPRIAVYDIQFSTPHTLADCTPE